MARTANALHILVKHKEVIINQKPRFYLYSFIANL